MKDVQRSEHYLTELLNITQDTIYTIDKDGKILTFNRYFEESMKRYGIQIDKGFDYLSVLPSEEEKQSQRTIIDKVFEGEAIEIPLFYEVEGGEIHLISNYSPIRNVEGEIVAVAVYSRDVTELVMAKQKAGQAGK
jgi:PAS domain S-box-containing protein